MVRIIHGYKEFSSTKGNFSGAYYTQMRIIHGKLWGKFDGLHSTVLLSLVFELTTSRSQMQTMFCLIPENLIHVFTLKILNTKENLRGSFQSE